MRVWTVTVPNGATRRAVGAGTLRRSHTPATTRSGAQIRRHMSASISPAKELLHSAGDEDRHVNQDPRQRDATGCDQILRHPGGVELRLVTSQSVKVVKMLALSKHEIAHAMPGGGERMVLKAGKRRHA